MIWGFVIFRRLLRETVEEIATTKSREDLFAARELIRQITDRSEIIDRPTEVQRRLVDDLLDVNRISQGSYSLRRSKLT